MAATDPRTALFVSYDDEGNITAMYQPARRDRASFRLAYGFARRNRGERIELCATISHDAGDQPETFALHTLRELQA